MNKKITALVFFVVLALVACRSPQPVALTPTAKVLTPSPTWTPSLDQSIVRLDFYSPEIPNCLVEGEEFTVTVEMKFKGSFSEQTFSFTWIALDGGGILVVNLDQNISVELHSKVDVMIEVTLLRMREGETEFFTVKLPVFRFEGVRENQACFDLPDQELIPLDRI